MSSFELSGPEPSPPPTTSRAPAAGPTIRIYRVPGLTLAQVSPEEQPPTAVYSSLEALRHALALRTDESPFTAAERAALELALRSVHADAGAEIFIAGGGSLFRVRPTARPKEAAPERVAWRAQAAARVLVVGEDAHLVRLVDALRFVGYEASSVTSAAPRSVIPAISKHDPHALIVPAEEWSALGPELAAAGLLMWGPALVLLGAPPPPDGVTPAVSAFIPRPIRVAALAATLDPAIAHAKRTRS